jgi:hypothetical protein
MKRNRKSLIDKTNAKRIKNQSAKTRVLMLSWKMIVRHSHLKQKLSKILLLSKSKSQKVKKIRRRNQKFRK